MSSIEISAQPVTSPALHVGGKILARNTVLNIIGQVVPLLVGFATTPYVIRHLGPDRFGILSLAWMVVGYFALFDLGIGPATTKFVAELLGKGDVEKLPAVVWTALATQSTMGLVAGVLLAASSPALVNHVFKMPPALRSDARWVFLILAVSFPINFASGSLRGVLAAFQRFDLANAIGVPATALWYLIPAAALAFGLDLPGIVLLLVISRVMALGAHFLFCQRLCPALARDRAFNRSLVGPLLGFGGWVTLSAAINPILGYLERFLIGALIAVAAVGFYTPPYMISSRLAIIPGSLTAALFPAFSASAGRGDGAWIKNALLRSLKCLILIVGPAVLLLIFFARPFLTLWLGPKFAAEGTLVLQILAAGALVNSLAYVPLSLLQGVGRPDLAAKVYLLEVPLYVVAAWFLVGRFGLPGAALAFALRVSLDFLLLIVAACWVTRTSPRLLAAKDILAGVAALAALAVGFSALWNWSQAVLADAFFAVLLTAGFLLAAWRFVLDVEERRHVKLWLKAAL